jgi:hypothetical protein
MSKIEKLTQAGGKEWISGAMHRVYFDYDVVNKLAGYKVAYKSNGSLIFCYGPDGAAMSKSAAYRVLADETSKFYYDVTTGQFGGRGMHESTINAAAAALAEIVA